MLKELGAYKQIIDKELELFFNEKLRKAEKIDPSSVEMINLLREYTLRGGKRIRAALVYYGYRCFSNKKLSQIIKASMCIELMQSYFLIHDDVMDNSDLRRGKPSLHKTYETICKKRYKNTDSNHFGISMAILAGDILSAFANEILARVNIKDKYKIAAINILNHTTNKVVYGQVLDILSELKPVKAKDISLIHKMKTASYTIECPLHIGALLAGADKNN